MTLGNMKDVLVPIQVIIGETDLTVDELSKLRAGTIVELKSIAGDPVNVTAAGKIVAKAEVVVIDENFGVRVTEVVDEEE